MPSPAVEVSHAGEIAASLPSPLFKIRLRSEFGHMADTQIRDQRQSRRDSKRCFQLFEIENAHPANAERLGTRREPQILNGANGRVEIDRRVRLPAQSLALAAVVIAGDTNVNRRLQDAREFQSVVKPP